MRATSRQYAWASTCPDYGTRLAGYHNALRARDQAGSPTGCGENLMEMKIIPWASSREGDEIPLAIYLLVGYTQ